MSQEQPDTRRYEYEIEVHAPADAVWAALTLPAARGRDHRGADGVLPHPRTPEWDGFYDGTRVGWWGYLRMRAHYVQHHAGRRRRYLLVIAPMTVPPEQA